MRYGTSHVSHRGATNESAMTKKNTIPWKAFLCCGVFIWLIVNLLQGIFTEIQEDEAYYALYGEHLAWGYFDHPPMVGLMAFLSRMVFPGALGVRLVTVIFSCVTLLVIWRILRPPRPTGRDVLLFLVLAFSIVMFNVYGFVTTPDGSLILFSALFLLAYRHYLEDRSWKLALWMGLLMAQMVYSKYHAFLLLALVALSNPSLLRDGKFYVACLLALAVLTPHILWQFQAGFPSLRYHLLQRSEPFRWLYFLEYLPNQLIVFNPFTFGAVVYVLVKRNPEGLGATRPSPHVVFERGLKCILVGFFLFFWLMSFRGHVEPHWTIACSVPVIVLVYRKAIDDQRLRRYIMRFVLPSLLLIVAFRIFLVTPLAARWGFNGKKAYYEAMATIAGDRPVVFRGSFQKPALYHYFTGKESSTLRAFYDRMTQYDLWQFDKAWLGREVFVCGADNNLSERYSVSGTEVEGYFCHDFSSANRLVTRFSITNAGDGSEPVFHSGDTIQMDFAIHNPYEAPVDFQRKDFRITLKALYQPNHSFAYCFYDNIPQIAPHSTYRGHLHTVVGGDLPEGVYHFNLSIGDGMASYVTERSALKISILP